MVRVFTGIVLNYIIRILVAAFVELNDTISVLVAVYEANNCTISLSAPVYVVINNISIKGCSICSF